MNIQLSTDKHIEGSEPMAEHVRTVIKKHLAHFEDKISRVEVHLGDENGGKTGQKDQRCMMEARPKGFDPIVVTELAPSMHQAIEGAAERLRRTLTSHFEKLDAHR